MPRIKLAPGKHKRAQASAQPEHPATTLAIKMHEPMEEALALLRALVLVGHGMTEVGNDEAHVVLMLARAASERVHQIDDAWIDLLQIARQ